MYLFARLVSLAVFVVVLIMMCVFISNSKDRKKAARLLTVYVIILSVMGYLFVPHPGADLTRLFLTMHAYAARDLSGIIRELTHNSSPGDVLYFYAIGKLGNDRLLPAVSALITFSFCFALLRGLLKKENTGITTTDIAVALFLFMSRGLMMQIISNIRTIMALSIAAWCVYQEIYNRRKVKTLLLPYLLAASLHNMGIIVLLYRIAYSLIEKGGSLRQKTNRWALAGMLGASALIAGWKYVAVLLEKARNYIGYALSGGGYDYVWERVLCVMTLLILLYIIHFFRRAHRHTSRSGTADEVSRATQKLLEYLTPLIVADIVFMFVEFNIFQRTNWYFTILLLPLTVCTLREVRLAGPDHARIFRSNLLIAAFGMLVLACARGDLCSLKFFGG